VPCTHYRPFSLSGVALAESRVILPGLPVPGARRLPPHLAEAAFRLAASYPPLTRSIDDHKFFPRPVRRSSSCWCPGFTHHPTQTNPPTYPQWPATPMPDRTAFAFLRQRHPPTPWTKLKQLVWSRFGALTTYFANLAKFFFFFLNIFEWRRSPPLCPQP